jgi:putative ABC transport system substrate-binding protein
MMNRRTLIAAAGAMVALPLPSYVERPAMPVVGFLGMTSAEASTPFLAAFHAGLKESGFVEGRNVVFAYRWAEGRSERLPVLASDLVALKVAVIVTATAAGTARNATQTIPIAFITAGDPVSAGLVTNLSRPGGNATGVGFLSVELIPKRLELLRDLVPNARSIAWLVNLEGSDPLPGTVQAAVRAIGFDLRILEARTAIEIRHAFARIAKRRPDALLVRSYALNVIRRDQIVALAERHAIPAMYDFPDFVTAGGLISYGPNLRDAFRTLGMYAGKILAGAKPADLSVQQPTRFELVINLKTAKALGLTVPSSLIDRADEVIE